ncbi:serine O-acetyltransferase [Magnetovibrio sp. PR-2]|uniref:serine O-acetyltransferase n=1 Tax=Magnetovibrio sp. PR-2 TaxID=3120356 RepID=UPI002FCE114D
MPHDVVPAPAKKLGLFGMIREDINCVFDRDPAARTKFEVLTTYPGVHAVINHRIAHKLWTKGFRYAARLWAFFSRMFSGIEIHPGATIGHRFFIDHGTGVVIGETAEIGDDVTLYHGVTLGGTSWSRGKRHPSLEDGVVVGGGAMILGPITVGKNAKVGANSVVIADVPENRTVVGIPGRVVHTSEAAHLNPAGIDLNHHLIPDPVADAMSCVLERIAVLEDRLGVSDGNCIECEGEAVCENVSPDARKRGRVHIPLPRAAGE